MSDECIHGFPDGLCAICNPKPVPEAVRTATRVTATRTRSTAAPRAARESVRVAPPVTAYNLLEQRVYHLTHVRNLPGILRSGALLAAPEPEVGLTDAALREERADATVPVAGAEPSLSTYVPFFLSPEATQWRALRDGEEHPRIARAARAWDAADYVFLISTLRGVIAAELPFVVADGNPQGSLARFASTREDAERMLRRLHTAGALPDAELLVPERFPLSAVTLIGVCNDKVRATVRGVIADAPASGFAPKVAVYPPWFVAAP